MMNFNDIYTLLKDGHTPEEIAEAFSNALNDANETYELELAEARTPCEVLMDDMHADGYFDEDDEYFADWSFSDYCELLSLVWNKAVIAYNSENDCNLEAYLSVPEAQELMTSTLKIHKSFNELTARCHNTASKCRNKASNAIARCDVTGTIDEFEKTLADFIKNL